MEIVALMVAVLALGISLVSLIVDGRTANEAARSADAAETSATEAERSATAAEDSVELTRMERDRATERADIEFVLKQEVGEIVLRHVGTTPAAGVEGVVTVAGVRRTLDLGDIAPNERVVVFDATAERDEMIAAKKASDESFRAAGWAVLRGGDGGSLTFKGRFTWVSPKGTPNLQIFE
ncbi:hypothetical protein ASD11_04515 [Aeromicrobium sp. Root495]|uniref:hypothetical protein n=1 Tax=Aeromicrobium sp. Root495 TaxID=1736550 RepID=UPI0006FB79F9|nr:hypothetical protein [Aeromicrobium sp. Root495]KQY58896.1 hypothetical protein ASD11_04515 [Aeromicrobium sp. Root495]